MPLINENALVKITSTKVEDLHSIKMPGFDKPLESMTVNELVHIRPGLESGDYTIEAVTSDISVNTARTFDKSLQVMEAGRLVTVLDAAPDLSSRIIALDSKIAALDSKVASIADNKR